MQGHTRRLKIRGNNSKHNYPCMQVASIHMAATDAAHAASEWLEGGGKGACVACGRRRSTPPSNCFRRPCAETKDWVDKYGNEPRKGSDILVQALEREGVTQASFYPMRMARHAPCVGQVDTVRACWLPA